MNALATSYLTLTSVSPIDQQQRNDGAHFGRQWNDDFARLAVAGALGKSGEGVANGLAISSGSTLVQILSTSPPARLIFQSASFGWRSAIG